MASKKKGGAEQVVLGRASTAPDELTVNAIQAGRLSGLTGLPVDQIEGRQIRELAERLRWDIDIGLLEFRRVCGRVVKTDPATGIAYPVPFATVHVLDTICDYWGFFPEGWPWGWLFPYHCETEEITSVVTDQCGDFCVWIPRFEIEWILRWRRERICFEEFFVRPSIGDLMRRLTAEEEAVRPPVPPGPGPLDPVQLAAREDVKSLLSPQARAALVAAQSAPGFGAATGALLEQLNVNAFPDGLHPPISADLLQLHAEGDKQAVAERLGAEPKQIAGIDLARYRGPFIRCFEVLVPEWEPIIEVPDVSFLVTQEVDGKEETIYEGAFDVPWSADPIPPVTLQASPIAAALAAPVCGPAFPCGDPTIERIGLLPVHSAPTYFDEATGFATRPNQPHPLGLFASPKSYPATAPFEGELQFYGCNHYPGAEYYRLRYAYASGNGLPTPAAFSPAVAFLNAWEVFRWAPGFQKRNITPDTEGWYEILQDAEGWQPEHLLLDWVTSGEGVYQVYLDLGNAAKKVIHTAGPLTLVVDNTRPQAIFTPGVLGWRYAGSGAVFAPLPLSCPLIQRAAQPIEIQVGVSVNAEHLRSVQLTGEGCGGVAPQPPADLAFTQHWHESALDNSWSTVAVFTLGGDAPAGCYTFVITAGSRAFNPAGYDGGFAADWYYDPMPLYVTPSISIAVVAA